jgi:WD40 repeat protein
MNERLKQTLEAMANRGTDPGATTAWEQARAGAPARRRRRRIRTSLAVATAILVVAGVAVALGTRSSNPHRVVVATPTTNAVTPPPSTEAIAFTRDLAIWTIEPSGAGLHRLTPPGCCSVSSWNPAHTLLALDYNGQLTIMKPDGTRLNSFDATTIFPPAWSPDGKQIAFAASPAGGSNGGPIEIVDAVGESAPRVAGRVFAGAVSWSPDGNEIAFTALDEPLHIEVLTIASGKTRALTSTPGQEQHGPAWSHITGRIAFASGDGIYDARAGGSDVRPIVSCPTPSCGITSPAWSADGKSIAFGRRAAGVAQLFLVDLATRDVRQLTFGASPALLPSW